MAIDPTDPLGEIGKAFGAFGDLLKTAVVAPLESVQNTLQSLALADFAKSLSDLGESIASIVKLADPALFQRFQVVLQDLWAVIGRALAPLLEHVVMPIMRMLADALTELEPIGAILAEALQPLVELFGMLMDAFAEGLKLVAKLLKEVVPFVVAFGRVLNDFVRQIGRWIRELLALIGIDLGDEFGAKKGSSVGAAAKQAQITDFFSAIKTAQTNAFSLGRPGTDTATVVSDIRAKAGNIYDAIVSLPGKIADAIRDILTSKGDPKAYSAAIGEAVDKSRAFAARPDVMASAPVTSFVAKTISRLYPAGYPKGE